MPPHSRYYRRCPFAIAAASSRDVDYRSDEEYERLRLEREQRREEMSRLFTFDKGDNRLVRRAFELTDVINGLEGMMMEMADEELTGMTVNFRQRVAAGATVEDILPEAFAVVREASRRVLGMRHFDVQIIGGIVLHRGCVAQMNTGEGKTLVATLPAYINALTGKGVYVATVNDFLAVRDATQMGVLYRFLGLSCAAITKDMSGPEKRQICAETDVVYVTGQNLAFCWLFDQRAMHPDTEILTRPLHYAIIDEADSILIDEAVNPLILGETEQLTEAERHNIEIATEIASCMRQCPDRKRDGTVILLEDQEEFGGDFACNVVKRMVSLTLDGQNKLLSLLVAKKLLPPNADANALWGHSRAWGPLVTTALQARACYLRDTHYVVVDDEIKILQESTGRISEKTRWLDGLHQAVEAKEGVMIRGDNVTYASITYMVFFSMFENLAGMTGTAMPAKYELFVNYQLPVYVIPPHREMKRIDHEPRIYPDRERKLQAIGRLVVACFHRNQPVLIGTESVEDSVTLYRFLQALYPLKCQLLNAKPEFVKLEAEIVAQAGLPAAITISTAMAGRGVDIKLGGDPSGLTKGALQRTLFPWLLRNGDQEVRRLPYYRVAIDLDDPGSTVLPPTVSGLLTRALAMAKCYVEKGSYSSQQVDTFVDLVMDHAHSILQQADREAVANREQVQLINQLAKLMAQTESRVTGDSVLKATVNAAMGLTLFFREYSNMLGDEVRKAGGLMVIGASWMPNERVAAQLRGRAGRQGDPGESIIVSCPGDLHLDTIPESLAWTIAKYPEGFVQARFLQRYMPELSQGGSAAESARSQMKRDDDIFQEFRISWYKLRRLFLTGSDNDVSDVLFQYLQVQAKPSVPIWLGLRVHAHHALAYFVPMQHFLIIQFHGVSNLLRCSSSPSISTFVLLQGFAEELIQTHIECNNIDPRRSPITWELDSMLEEVATVVNRPVDQSIGHETEVSDGVVVTTFSPIQIQLKFMTGDHRLGMKWALVMDTAMPDYEHDYPITLRMKVWKMHHLALDCCDS